MKAKIFSLLLFILLGTYSVNGQVDMMKSAEETARRLDEMDGKSTPTRRENADNSTNYDYPDNNRTPDENNELREHWEEMFGRLMEGVRPAIDKFDTSETRCIFIMVIYLDAYMDLVEQTYAANDCKTKSDGYAMQAIAIAAAASIMYCPESLSNKTLEEQIQIWRRLERILENQDNNRWITEWESRLERVLGEHNHLSALNIDEMNKFFHPNYIISALLEIQQSLEELNCPD